MTPIEDTLIHAAERFLSHHSTAAAAVLPLADGKVVAVGEQYAVTAMLMDPTIAAKFAVQYLQDTCHKAAADAGWWSNDATNQNNPLCFSNKIALVHSEVSEALEGDRKSMQDEHIPTRPSREVELADALIRIFDLGGAFGMDLAGALVEKMAYNAKRLDHKAAARNAEGGKAY